MFLLDTNVVSELRKVESGKADAQVAAWQAQVERAACFVSAITLMAVSYTHLDVYKRQA